MLLRQLLPEISLHDEDEGEEDSPRASRARLAARAVAGERAQTFPLSPFGPRVEHPTTPLDDHLCLLSPFKQPSQRSSSLSM
jgi:hypothetical protein